MHLCEIHDKLLVLTIHPSLRKEDCQVEGGLRQPYRN